MEPRVSIITLGVDDLPRAIRFSESMGLERNEKITDGVAFFQMGGLILALWPREELARDAGKEYRPRQSAPVAVEKAGKGFIETVGRDFSGVALAYNTRSEPEVYAVLERVEKAGGKIVKPVQRAIFGGRRAISRIPKAISGRSPTIPTSRSTRRDAYRCRSDAAAGLDRASTHSERAGGRTIAAFRERRA